MAKNRTLSACDGPGGIIAYRTVGFDLIVIADICKFPSILRYLQDWREV